MKILLLFPPDWLPSEPYLSLPALTSVLRPAGHKVIQKDINVEMYDMFFSRPFLEQVSDRITGELNHLIHVEKQRALDEEESTLKVQLLESTPEVLSQLSSDAEEAKEILRGESFYDIDKLEWATNTLHQTMARISLGYYPAQICFPPIETDLAYKPFMSSEILEAMDDDQINVYRDVYRQLIAPVMKKEKPGMVGISIVQQKQIIPTFTFSKMIKEEFPDVHITIGGNIVTRIRDELKTQDKLFGYIDSAVLYEGENAYLQLVDAVENSKPLSGLPNLIYRDESGIHANKDVCSEDLSKLPPPDFDGLALKKYFVPKLILPFLATRGCYWGRCTFCDHFQGYVEGFRTMQVDQIIDEIRFLQNKYKTRYFHFTDESYPPALFRKLSQRIVEEKLDIVWTTHMRFEETLLDEQVWKDAHASGCRYLHFGFESGNQRVHKLIMGFFGFPGETREEAEDSKQFVLKNREHVHSLGFMTYVLGKYSPVAFEPEKYGVSYYKNPEWDLAMDYYFTLEKGLNIQEALDVFEDFERNHDPKWDLRTCVREYVYLYIEHFGNNNLPQLKMRSDQQKENHHTSIGMV